MPNTSLHDAEVRRADGTPATIGEIAGGRPVALIAVRYFG